MILLKIGDGEKKGTALPVGLWAQAVANRCSPGLSSEEFAKMAGGDLAKHHAKHH